MKSIFDRHSNKSDDTNPARKAMTRSIVIMACVLLVLSFSVGAYITGAWYATNREVDGKNFGVYSDEAPTSLFISAGSTVDNAWNVSLSRTLTDCKLYPISTADCSSWYYASGWSRGSFAEGTGWTSDAVNGAKKVYASSFTAASASITDGVATYTNTAEGNTSKVAYMMDEYMIYTNQDSLAVYFDPAAPIAISYADNGVNLEKAIRVGIAVGNTLKFVYAPVAETGYGNCIGITSSGNFYAVTGASSVAAQSGVLTDLSAYTAGGSSSDGYTAGTTSLGTATTSGLNVKVFVWLEGTDADAVIGSSDNITDALTVSVNLVGVEIN